MKTSSKLHNTIKRLVYCLLAVLIVVVVISIAGSAIVMRVMFARDDLPHNLELTYADADAAKYPRRAVSFESCGNTLQGYIYERPDPAGLIIVVNGVSSSADRHLSEIIYFLDHDWEVFAFNGTGIGESGGDWMKGLPQTKLDLLAALDAVRSDPQASGLPIVLYGHSVGGYASIASLAEADDVCAVACLAGFNSPIETMYFHAQQYVGFLAHIEYPFLCLETWLLFGSDGNGSALEALNSTDTPVALIEGSNDDVVPSDIGISRFRDQITNPNTEYITVDSPYRSTHSSLWLSEEAAKAADALTDNKSELTLTSEERWEINSVDPDFMDRIISFFETAVANRR